MQTVFRNCLCFVLCSHTWVQYLPSPEPLSSTRRFGIQKRRGQTSSAKTFVTLWHLLQHVPLSGTVCCIYSKKCSKGAGKSLHTLCVYTLYICVISCPCWGSVVGSCTEISGSVSVCSTKTWGLELGELQHLLQLFSLTWEHRVAILI